MRTLTDPVVPESQWRKLLLSRDHAEPPVRPLGGQMASHFWILKYHRVSEGWWGTEWWYIACWIPLRRICFYSSTSFPSTNVNHHPASSMMDILYHFPALAPPIGVTPNFTHPQSQALMVTVTSIICLVLIITISTLRFYTNFWIKKSLKPDDCEYRTACFRCE